MTEVESNSDGGAEGGGLIGRWLFALEPPIPAGDLEAELGANSLLSFGFLFMIAISASLATLGLIANSAAVIIGAMIIAPLMNPITAAAFSIVRGDPRILGVYRRTCIAATGGGRTG